MDVGALPISARVHLTHAVVQVLAERAGVDLLHMKGPAFDPALRPRGHSSSDADVLVRPGDVDRLESALAAHGWERFTDFDSGSAFEHAANWFHPNWGYVDVHALWPGPRASPEETYRVLSERSRPVLIAHCECRAPDRISQILILMLHAARSPNKSDIDSAWTEAGDQERAEVRRLADRLAARHSRSDWARPRTPQTRSRVCGRTMRSGAAGCRSGPPGSALLAPGGRRPAWSGLRCGSTATICAWSWGISRAVRRWPGGRACGCAGRSRTPSTPC